MISQGFWAFDYSSFVGVGTDFQTSQYLSIDYQQSILACTYRIPAMTRIIGLHIRDITCYGSLHLHLMADDDIDFKTDILEDGGIRLDF